MPSSYKKRIYRATVSQRLRNTGLEYMSELRVVEYITSEVRRLLFRYTVWIQEKSKHKNIVEQCWPQVTLRCMRIACWIPKATKHTLRICNTYCFSATVVAQTRPAITFIRILPVLLYIDLSPCDAIVYLHPRLILTYGLTFVCSWVGCLHRHAK